MPHTKKLIKNSLAVSIQLIERRIYLIRGLKVMIDVDLAELYGVPTKRLNERVRRNSKRFPEDFMFQLTKAESECLRSQFATSKAGRGGRRSLPYVFTEQGVHSGELFIHRFHRLRRFAVGRYTVGVRQSQPRVCFETLGEVWLFRRNAESVG